MRIFANLFLILFFADGSLSLVDELVSLFIHLGVLSEIRNILADIVIFTAIPLYLCLGIDKRLPKRVFLPLVLYILWCPFSLWFFPSLADRQYYGLSMAAGQVFLCLLPFFSFRGTGARFPFMPKKIFTSPFFSLKNTLAFCAANLFVVPVVLVLVFLCAANTFLQGYTAGFMRLGPDGLHMIEKVYRRDGKTIRLVAMIHMGEKEYYDELAGSVAHGRSIILEEGVTDDENLLRNGLDYGKVAGFLGLSSQEKMRFKGNVIDGNELESASQESAEKEEKAADCPDILRADTDVSTFRPQTILFLDTLGKYMAENETFIDGYMSFNSWAKKNMTPEMNRILMDDILYGRNRELIRNMRMVLDRYDTIVVPWGALHMPGIEREVLEQGFVLRQQRERTSIDLMKIFRGMLRGNFAEHSPVAESGIQEPECTRR